MVQAIVFLPLLGAILAGLIAIFGAHARNPSGDTVEHHNDAHGHGAHVTGYEPDPRRTLLCTSPSDTKRVWHHVSWPC